MTPGIGMKSRRTEARELHVKMGWRPERIAEALNVDDVEQVREWIYGKRPEPKKRASISAASPEQRKKVKDKACIVCRKHAGRCHPAHLIDRSLGGDDDPRAVVPLCPGCHREYDEGDLDLLPFLEPHYREEQGYASELIGTARAYRRLTNGRVPELEAAV